ncbi:hypothetical protein AMR72_16265 [Flavobacterium psychrophilum]|nr:hypothetical protein AMR72_16265 [Flavobacterium psychrophilum]AOE53919.1 hypothetical protein ALW18_16255 [Flavobacterium psychrophilum]
MEIIGKFNRLHHQILKRKEVKILISDALEHEQTSIAKRLGAILDAHPKEKCFRIEITRPAIEVVPESFLHCLDCENDLDDKIVGLGKAVSPNEIYQMMTDKMIKLIKEANAKDWSKPWESKYYGKGYTMPFNFVTKKMYRGINRILLTGFKPLENPFFLTFKQINDLKGKLKKGSKGTEVVYFTKLYIYHDAKKKIDISTYDKDKFKGMLSSFGLPIDNIEKHALPILKYYKVFNGVDIEGIDFDLANFKHGLIDNPRPADDEHRMPVCEAIIKIYPDPSPKHVFGGDSASYNSGSDILKMPYLTDFNTAQEYYTTFFHELAHSTGHHSRLSRNLRNRFGSKEYAFEELIAEFSATFLSAEAGIIFHTSKNSAAYLKGWNAALTHLKDDNRFLMRAATQAQKAADFILQYDEKGDPAYFGEIKALISPEKKKVKKKTVKRISKPGNKTQQTLHPVSYSKKPKSISVATAIANVLSTGNYPVKPLQANVLFTVLKGIEDLTAEEIQLSTSPFQKSILNVIPEELLWYYERDDTITLYDKGIKLILAIRGRLESLRNQKTSYALFDNLNGQRTNNTSEGLNAAVIQVPIVIENAIKDPVIYPDTSNYIEENKNEVENELPVDSIITTPRTPKNPLVQAINYNGNQETGEFYTVDGEVGKFLQRVERKPVHSVVITMDGQQGAGKTTTLYKFMHAFATPGNRCLFISAEEHPASSLAMDKVNKYLSHVAQQNIDTVAEVDNTQQLYDLIADYDVIFIDSWQKLQRMVGLIRLDEDLRKRFNGKVFVIIFQQTTTGRTKGGAEVVFDGDIIIKMVKEARFSDNYAYFDKNRYTIVPLETIFFNIANGEVYNPEESEVDAEPELTIASSVTKLKFTVV